jgi:predicted amidohydrolase YtcJ
LRELSGSELLFPSGLDLLDGFADRSDHGVSFGCEVHALGALVAFVGFARLGALEPGMLADLVAYPRDPLDTPIDQLPDLKPRLTLVGGRPIYDPDGVVGGAGTGS